MSKTSMLLRSVLPVLAAAFFAAPAFADPPQVCQYPVPGSDCTLTVTITPVAPDPTVICPQGEQVFELSFSIQCIENLCSGLPDPILVCGAWGTDLNITVCGEAHTLDLKKNFKWRDAYANCSRLQLL